jgi:site-specific DNA recombinase
MTKRAVLYLRLSVAFGGDASDSIVRQEADLRALAQREGWDVVRVFTDDGISGGKERDNARLALAMLADDEADVLAVFKLDRFGRRGARDIVAIEDALEARSKTRRPALFVSLMDGLRSDVAMWDTIASLYAGQAKQERLNTSMRVARSIKTNRGEGRFVGGTVPFGFRTAARPERGRMLVPYAPEVAVVREFAERILAGESQAALLDDLTARAVPTTRSPARLASIQGLPTEGLSTGSWSYSGLASVWTGDALLGRVTRSRLVENDDGSTTKVWETVRDADGLPLVAHEAILDSATVQRLRTHLRDPKRPSTRRERRPRRARLLSGLIYCDTCGSKLWVTVQGGRTVYCCQRKAGICPGPNMKAENAERAVAEKFLAVAGAWPEVEEVEEVTLPETVAELREIEADIRNAIATLADDGVDGAAVLRHVDLLKARRGDLQALPSAVTVRAVPTGRSIAEAWEAADVDARRLLLGAAMDHVRLRSTDSKGHTGYHPERVDVVWHS